MRKGIAKLPKRSHLQFGLVLGTGALIALVLFVQCVRTYWYIDAVLVPQAAQREAERQVGALTIAARSAGISDGHSLGPVIEHVLESAADRVLWMRVLDGESHLLAQGGKPQGTAKVPSRWWERVETHENSGVLVDTPEGRAFVTMLPFRIPRPLHPFERGIRPPDPPNHLPGVRRVPAYVIELAIPLTAVSGAFDGLRHNLIVGIVASLALLLAVAVIGLRTPQYLRGKHLESELQLAKRVQSDLQPKPYSVSPHIEFAASAIAADHVGGDFYDIFETSSGQIAIMLGDVSGKGMPAALLVSVLQGAIRSSTASQHELACEQINRMLCERTACERFATLFWGVFDPVTGTLRYVNAGHAAPMLVRRGANQIERLDEGGPVLGLLPAARYSAKSVEIQTSDTLILYSDGVNEATNGNEEEFGEDRIQQVVTGAATATPAELCEQMTNRVAVFTGGGALADDRTLLVVRLLPSQAVLQQSRGIRIGAVA